MSVHSASKAYNPDEYTRPITSEDNSEAKLIIFPLSAEARKRDLEDELDQVGDAIAINSRKLAKLLEGNGSYIDMGQGLYLFDAKREIQIRKTSRLLYTLLADSEKLQKEYNEL